MCLRSTYNTFKTRLERALKLISIKFIVSMQEPCGIQTKVLLDEIQIGR